ncbi:MAG: hypothetical protein ACKVPY_07685 [Paracoccaceae bacterium]
MTPTAYLVLEPTQLIASDLATSLCECDPSADVLMAHSAEAALAALSRAGLFRLAFLHVDPDDFAASDLGRALIARRTTCVFMGEQAERRRDMSAYVLQWPFSPQTMAALLIGLSAESAVA